MIQQALGNHYIANVNEAHQIYGWQVKLDAGLQGEFSPVVCLDSSAFESEKERADGKTNSHSSHESILWTHSEA